MQTKYTAKFLVVEWPDRDAAILFQLDDGIYKFFEHGGWDSSLEDWDTSNATIHEVNT